ncbi:MAG: hypothetical protein F9K45_05360 [Melioribacteraceae bacterium]|nr:MAG: hypothetical protein F9K45_05360 [Melioribacteraceae bacterium]
MEKSLLKLTLRINWIFSALSGLTLLLFNSLYQNLFEINYPFYQTGTSLLFFAAFVFFAERKKILSKVFIITIICMDILWVVFCFALLLGNTGISSLGNWLIGLSALIVMDFAIFQSIGLKRALKK